jgi:RimJ/RimL family protein N-acetyltransferase
MTLDTIRRLQRPVVHAASDRRRRGVGTVGSFTMEGEREVTYWISPVRWGQGLASRALQAFLAIEQTSPIYGRVAEHNAASAKVLARAGLSRWAPKRRSRQESAPRSSSTSIDSIK